MEKQKSHVLKIIGKKLIVSFFLIQNKNSTLA